ncbi:MAG: CPA1 family monovalent cation:H+ antiporter [Verrucomicrobiales bacterium]|jgi:CPA1 family monovalent cation:H+ antiporter
MGIFDIAACLITLAALFGYVNFRWIKLPTTIGVMLISLCFSLLLVLLSLVSPEIVETANSFMAKIDFNEAVLNCMLSFLLFAGALHVDLNDLANQKRLIAVLASVGVVMSTFIVGTLIYFLLGAFGVEFRFIYCLLFGALISPTDPVAVLGILKTVGVPKSMETKITGESLFNDGVGVVVFLAILAIATGKSDGSVGDVAHLFLMEAGGGVMLGAIFGALAYFLLKTVDNYQVEVLITLALVMGVYSLALAWHMSGPLAMVVAGLMIGNHGRQLAMSDVTRDHLDKFWELIDEVLNAMLFVLIGLEFLVLQITGQNVMLGLIAIPIVLFARLIAVATPISILKNFREFSKGVIPILTWGGLRGGISVALALAIPPGPEREVFLTMTYVIVIFSIAVQGLTLKPLIRKVTHVAS